jgi:hypothetical protein
MFPNNSILPGDHIRVSRGTYYHHGIYVGDLQVVHFTGAARRLQDATIRLDTLHAFAAGGSVQVVKYARCYNAESVVQLALSRLGENGYRVFANNCEHFARWCKTGEHRSAQAQTAAASAAGVGGGAAAAAGALGLVSAGGAVAGLSGAGMMSGLASVGAAVGAGAAGGLGVLAAGPAVVATAAMRHALKDDPMLPEREREARRAGRAGTAVGAAAGTAASIAAVSAAGSVAGLSAAGITSGLAAIGGAVGGGMAAGVVLTVGAPAAICAAVGYGIYRFLKSRPAG